MENAVLQALAAFRWVAWAWMAVVLLVSRGALEHPLVAISLLAAALVLTAGYAIAWRVRPAALLRPGLVAAELAVGATLVLFDGWVYGPGHAFTTSQSLGSVWPLVGVLAAGVALGPPAGLAAGAGIGLCRVGATLWNGAEIDTAGRVLSLLDTTVLYAVAGMLAGYLFRLLVRAEREVSAARAREELARTLHDGVLQTLALVERRAGDDALSRLAREQERELREFLFGSPGARRTAHGGDPPGGGSAGELGGAASDLGTALRAAAARFEGVYGGRVDVVLAPDLPAVAGAGVAALGGAVGEALTNAGKHGGAGRVTVYAEPSEDGRALFCSVKDDGGGFDTVTVPEGVGLARSVRGRMADAGGWAEVQSAPGFGTEVRLWLPV